MAPTRGDENYAILPYEFGHFEGFFVLKVGDGRRWKNQLLNAFSFHLEVYDRTMAGAARSEAYNPQSGDLVVTIEHILSNKFAKMFLVVSRY